MIVAFQAQSSEGLTLIICALREDNITSFASTGEWSHFTSWCKHKQL